MPRVKAPPKRRHHEVDDTECTCPCDNSEDCASCLCATCSLLKNPAVLLFLFCLCFIQGAIIIANITSSNTNQNRSLARASHRSSKNKEPQMPKLDWQFNTVIKVASKPGQIGEPLYQQNKHKDVATVKKKTNSTQRLKTNVVISYGSEDFQFPLLVDMLDLVDRVKRGEELTIKPVNPFNFNYIVDNKDKCSDVDDVDVVILIKSAPQNVLARNVIRETWGKENCWGGRIVRRIFLLGVVHNPPATKASEHMAQISREVFLYNDIVQSDFVDHYYNNTYKMMLGFEWATKFCVNARDILFVDDDYFVQPKTVMGYLESLSPSVRRKLVAGYVWRVANPVRGKRGDRKKWFVGLTEYPWKTYPAYCAAGAFFVSMEVAKDLVIAMRFTRYLRFDDVFLGLVLHKMLFLPIHLTGIYSFEPVKTDSPVFKNVIASHGYKNVNSIFTSWLALQSDNFCIK